MNWKQIFFILFKNLKFKFIINKFNMYDSFNNLKKNIYIY